MRCDGKEEGSEGGIVYVEGLVRGRNLYFFRIQCLESFLRFRQKYAERTQHTATYDSHENRLI